FVRGADQAPLALRPAAGRGIQVRADPQARSVARRARRSAAAPERPAHRRRRERRENRDQAAALEPERPGGDRSLHREASRFRMNQGLLSVDDALAQLLASARPVNEVEDVAALDATG